MLRVFKLDDTEETKKTAPVLLEAHFEQSHESPRDFTWHGSFHGMTPESFAQTFWLGHADTQTTGEFTPQKFVKKFNADFLAQFKNNASGKSKVLDLYFIGCETGLMHDGTSLAQQIADGLHAAGFVNVRVHAVASPPQREQAMMVKVVTSPIFGKTYRGQVRAMLLTRDQAKSYGEYSQRLKNLLAPSTHKTEQIRSVIRDVERLMTEIEEKAETFLDTLDIRAELDRPHNTFIPTQLVSRDRYRPEKKLAQEKALCQIEALMRDIAFSKAMEPKVEQQVKKFVAKLKINKSDDLGKLKELRHAVANCTDSSWIRYISDARKDFREGTPVRVSLDRIFLDANKSTPAPSFVPAAVVTSSSGSFFSQPLATLQQAAKDMSVKAVDAFKKSPPAMSAELRGVILRINALASNLETEAKGAWFTQGLKAYKARTLRELVMAIKTDFESQPLTPQWRQLISQAMKDPKLVQGVFSHRVWDLLNDILLTSSSNQRTLVLN